MKLNRLKKIRFGKSFRGLTSSLTFRLVIFLLVFLFTFILRSHNYDRVPTANHLDEMLYAWSGLYLIEEGVPVSWSTLDYPKRAEVFKGKISYQGGIPEASVTLYKPWLDEPPLFSLLVGSFAHLYQAKKTDFVPASYIRMPVVLLAGFTSIMIFLITRMVSGFWTGILAMLIFGTTPILVFASRTAMPENIIAFLLTVIMYLLLKFYQKPRFLYLIFLPVLVGIAGLSKPTGYFLLPLALFLIFSVLYKLKKSKQALLWCLYLIIGTLPFIIIYFWYGLHFDREIFWQITSTQSHRPVGFNSLAWFFISPAYRTQILKDSWYIFGLLSAAFFIFSPLEGLKKLISLAFVYWIAVVMISGGEGDLLPWYRFPSFPFLAILTAWGLQYLVKRADFFATFLAAGLLLGNRLLLVNPFRPNIDPTSFRLIFSALMLPSLSKFIFEKKWLDKVCRFIIIGVITVGIYFNTIYIYNAFELDCESKTCPIVPSTFLSSLRFPFIWRWLVVGETPIR